MFGQSEHSTTYISSFLVNVKFIGSVNKNRDVFKLKLLFLAWLAGQQEV